MLVRMSSPFGTLFGSVWERFGSESNGERIVRARALISSGEYMQALGLLDRLLSAAEDRGEMPLVVEVLTVKALALRDLGQVYGATNALARALSFGEREGYVRVFVSEGAPMAALLSEFLQRQREGRIDFSNSIPPEYVERLLAMIELRDSLPDDALAVGPTVSNERPAAST